MCKPKIDFPLTYAYSLLRMYKYNIYRFFNPLYILSSQLRGPRLGSSRSILKRYLPNNDLQVENGGLYKWRRHSNGDGSQLIKIVAGETRQRISRGWVLHYPLGRPLSVSFLFRASGNLTAKQARLEIFWVHTLPPEDGFLTADSCNLSMATLFGFTFLSVVVKLWVGRWPRFIF